jgi:hypothetical protein
MQRKKLRKNLTTAALIIVISSLAIALIVFSSIGASSSGGCCSGGCCGGCCGDDEVEDTDGDGTDMTEDATTTTPPEIPPTICQQKGLSSTKVDGTFQQQNMSNRYEYIYSYTITACKETVSYQVMLDGLKIVYPDPGGTVPMNSTKSGSGTYSSESLLGYENDDMFNKMCITVSDTSVGANGPGKFCYPEK